MSAAAIDYRSLIKPQIAFRLYNPSPTAVEGQHNGKFYRVPGRDEFYVDPRSGRPYSEAGVLPIAGYSYTVRLGDRTFEERFVTPEMIVAHLVGEDGVTGQIGGAGIRLLPPENDPRAADVKRDALEANKRKTYEDAGATIAAFEAMNAKRIEYKQTPLAPTPKVREAYRYRADVEREGTTELAKFQCPKCYEGIATESLLRQHIGELHAAFAPTLLKAAGLEAEAEKDEFYVDLAQNPEVPAKRGPGRPKKNPEAAA